MINLYQPKATKILQVKEEAPDVRSYVLQFVDPRHQQEFYFLSRNL